jgi:transcriptional regulator with XRE-family HTH domain
MKKTLGETITEARKERGMTQKDLAEQMNVTDKAVSKWERDLSCPDVHSLPKLAQVLGLSMEELMQTTKKEDQDSGGELRKAMGIALKAIPLAMSIAVVVGSALGKLTADQGLTLLGIGLFCLSVRAIKQEA